MLKAQKAFLNWSIIVKDFQNLKQLLHVVVLGWRIEFFQT